MYKELKKQIEDKKILEIQIRGLESRIRNKIQKELGLHATSYAELKIECPTVEDRFVRVFAKIENLDEDLQTLKSELTIIESTLDEIDKVIADMQDKEKKIFRCRYLWGMTVSETATRLGYSEDYIKELSRKMFKK